MLPVPPPLSYKTVREDLGPGVQGASHAHIVVTTDGLEYVAKGTQFDSGNLLGPANELIVAQLLDYLYIPIPPFLILSQGSRLLFGSEYIRRRLAASFTQEIFNKAGNKQDVYVMMVCDVWLCNIDRHARNILAERIDEGGDEADPEYKIWAIDHERAILGPGQGVADLLGQASIAFKRLVRALGPCISDQNMLDVAILNVELIPDSVIENSVDNVPHSMLDSAGKSGYKSFIRDRRLQIREIINANRHIFPNLL